MTFRIVWDRHPGLSTQAGMPVPQCENARLCYSAKMAINLRTVISELQFILELSNDNKGDSRLPDLLDHAKEDLSTAAQSLLADSPIINS